MTAAVGGETLVIDGDVPTELVPHLHRTQSGIRAVLGNRRRYGYGADGKGVGPCIDGSLNTQLDIPTVAIVVCCSGDAKWDRVRPFAA